MICKHEFVRINDATKARPHSVSWNGQIAGASAGCLNCGQIRKVFEDGSLAVVVEGSTPIDEDHGSD